MSTVLHPLSNHNDIPAHNERVSSVDASLNDSALSGNAANGNDPSRTDKSKTAWSLGRRLLVTIPIFIVLLGILVTVSNLTSVPWKRDPTEQSIATLSPNTAVTFDNPQGVPLAQKGSFKVVARTVKLDIKRPATGEIQHINVLIRQPQDSAGTNAKHPGVVFMHGAGYGTAENSFGDVAQDLSSAGFVTAVLDKPVWSTSDLTRDYPGSAKAYDQVVNYLRTQRNVDPDKVGLYATSESTWISPYVIKYDKHIAFQLLLSPMVYGPRQSLGFFVGQDFSLVGANNGYQSIVRRLFHTDTEMMGLHNLDFPMDLPQAYSVPTMVVYGSKDVLTAQVEGLEHILYSAHRAGNQNVTVRSYSVANHVLRLGDEADTGTPFADDYENDVISWATGTVAGLKQTSEPVAGTTIRQSIAVPRELKADRNLTIYGAIVNVGMVVLLLAAFLMALIGCVIKALRMIRGNHNKVFGFMRGFGGELFAITLTTLATFVLFATGLGQVIMAVVKLGWGGAPTEDPGMMYWSWPVIQVVSTLVVWAWARILARCIEVAQGRGLAQIPPRKGAIQDVVSGREPVFASKRFGRVFFWLVAAAMFSVLLFFAFWGLFIF
ncbi:alpha/beta hydrolase [Bifidobacterium sp. ESL0682]|uniref:alpha/beta hydrolase family protein n=1 Tax=Bifidobacterium sp. ESL0682 TaxID=2983212 RepID=UPI0023F8B666|nr:alpha/beta hydrolase [Bifidobacterium sp. ESL0682]WEV41603.1 alpha/beta hydrolase [Bifidobacterium sp. ESL0682]